MAPQPYRAEFIPSTRTEALSLLRSVDDRLELLNRPQRQAIRELYRLSDSQTVAQLVENGEVEISETDLDRIVRYLKGHNSFQPGIYEKISSMILSLPLSSRSSLRKSVPYLVKDENFRKALLDLLVDGDRQ